MQADSSVSLQWLGYAMCMMCTALCHGQAYTFPNAGVCVEVVGFEPRTSCMPCKRSNQLSYTPE